MKLSEELKVRGLNKSKLAELLDVSRQTVHRMGEEINDEVFEIIRDLPLTTDRPWDLSDDELNEIIRTRSGTTDEAICQERSWRIWEFNEAIAGWVKRNPYKKPENGYDLSKYKKGDIV